METIDELTVSLPQIYSGMKEQTYGWYPAVRDVYVERRLGVPSTYDMEAMYKFQDSKYYTAPNPPSPRPPNAFRPTPSPRRPQSGMSKSSNSQRSTPSLLRAKSAPVYHMRKIPKLQVPTPQQCWEEAERERQMAATPSSVSLPTSPPNVLEEKAPSVPSVLSSNSRRERVQSAVVRRSERTTPPQRPIYSAGPMRASPAAKPSDQAMVPCNHEPATPIPTPPLEEERPTTAEINQKNLREYGWRQEVHGNPFRLKKFSKRLPYYVTCKEPEVEKDGPKVKMECNETFFYNTIPRRPMTFTIHKEWISEAIHAQRMELQKREGVKHRWKNFSFVY